MSHSVKQLVGFLRSNAAKHMAAFLALEAEGASDQNPGMLGAGRVSLAYSEAADLIRDAYCKRTDREIDTGLGKVIVAAWIFDEGLPEVEVVEMICSYHGTDPEQEVTAIADAGRVVERDKVEWANEGKREYLP